LGHFSHDDARPEEALQQAADRVRRGRFVAMFPEGTRSRECTIGSFQSGAFRLAQQTTGRVQPVVVTGTHRVWGKGQFWIRNLGPVLMQVLPPEDVPAHLGRQELLAVIEGIRWKMLRVHAELSSRLPG
jgi:1-acyl-sn-glycerol-3-phosphate acyltransferase